MNLWMLKERVRLALEKTGRKSRQEDLDLFLRKNLQGGVAVGCGAWVAGTLVFEDAMMGFGLGALSGIFWGAWLLFAPFRALKKQAGAVEKDLAFALMALAVELNLGISFEQAMLDIARSGYGETSREFGLVHREITLVGASVPEALRHLSERVESREVRRAVSQLQNAYAQGSGKNRADPIRRIAVELLSKQRSEAKAFSGKFSVFALLFVAVSAIVPALFQSFVIIGSLFLSMEWTPLQVLLVIAVGFPLLDLLVLLYIQSQTPVFLRE